MSASSLAGVITAVATCLIALGGVVTAFSVLLPILRGTKNNSVQIQEVHTIVNQQRTDSMKYQEELIAALNIHGIRIPPDNSLRP